MSGHVIQTSKLTRKFRNKIALNKLSIDIPQGGVHAFIGANGAGKTTFFNILLGFDSPDQGSCQILGRDSQAINPEVREKIGYVNDAHALPHWLRVEEVTQIQRSMYKKWDENVFKNSIANFDIHPQQKVSTLSKGERAGVILSLALAQQPHLLILDEPTVGLDVVAKQRFLESLLFSKFENNCTIIYCSHHMEEIERVADNLIILERGELKNNSAPDAFCKRIQRWSCLLPEGQETSHAIPGLLEIKHIDDTHHLTVLDPPPSFKKDLESLGAQHCRVKQVGLADCVTAFLNKNHAVHS